MRVLITLFLIVLIECTASAQREIVDRARFNWLDRGYLGAGLGGLGIGTDGYYGRYFTVGISGQAGYMLTKSLSTGIGAEYQFTSYSDLHQSNNLYVVYPFVRYNIKDFFIQTDYDFYSLNVDLDKNKQRRVIERLFLGLGYSRYSGGRARFNFLVSYDLLYPSGNAFLSPLTTRVYFTF